MREDVTARRLGEVGHEGLYVSMGQSMKAAPGKGITKTELSVLGKVPPEGLDIGRVSKALLYAPAIKHLAYTKPERAALIKLLKRGLLRIERDTSTDKEYLVRVSHIANRRSVRRAAKRARVTARGRRRVSRKANPIPRGRALGQKSFTLSTLRAVKQGGRAEKIWYEDARDGKHYYHDFEGEQGAVMYLCESAAVGKCVLIVSGDFATPLWEDA